MTYEEAKTKPLNKLVGYLVELYEDCDCCCQCHMSNWRDDDEFWVKHSQKTAERCKSEGLYNQCAERIAYKRVMAACEKQMMKKPNIEKMSYYSVFKCPSCNTKLISKFKDDSYTGKKERYCHVCGQALDWSE